jgi:hypothetical protein
MVKHSRSARIRQPQPGISPAGVFRAERPPQMKFLRFALVALLALLATVFGIAYFKSSTWTAEGALVIETPPEKVLPLVAEPKRWLDWMPWCDPSDDGFEARFEGPESGAGAKLVWKSATRHGVLVIRSASAAEGVAYDLEMDDVPGHGEIRLEPYGVQTRARWRYSGDLGGNLFARYFIPFMQKALIPTLQKGLANLRDKALKGG